MAFTGHTRWYGSSAKYAAVTAWATGATIAAGALRRQLATPAVGSERVFIAVVGGTTHASTEPTWVITRGGKTTDNASVTWQEVTGIPALNGDLVNTPNWTNGAKNTAITVGHVIKDVAGTHIFICDSVTGTGTSGNGAEPTWDVSAVGNTTIDNAGANQVTWRYLGTSFSAWAAPAARVPNMLVATWGNAGSTSKFFVGHDHAETQATQSQWTAQGTDAAPIDILCVNTAGSMPPVSADLATTATVTTTAGAGSNLQLRGAFRICYGITFTAGTNGTNDMTPNLDGLRKYFEQCVFALGTAAGTGSRIGSADAATAATIYGPGCKFRFTSTSHQISPVGRHLFRGCSFADTGTVPTTLFDSSLRADVQIIGSDLSALSAKTIFGNPGGLINTGSLLDCKMPSSYTLAGRPSGPIARYWSSRSGPSGNNRSEIVEYMGDLFTELTVVRTGGASDGTTAIAHRMVTTANVNLGLPLSGFLFGTFNSVTGSNVIATVYGIINAAAMPNNDELYIDVDYLGDAGSPQSSDKTTRIADVLATAAALTADSTSAWDSIATARANSHAYSIGDVLKVASNPGRIFFCTAGGTSAGSEPGGYATAIDGGSVTDSGATFRAGCRFKMAVTLTTPQPQQIGNVYARARLSKVSTTVYIDPYLDLT